MTHHPDRPASRSGRDSSGFWDDFAPREATRNEDEPEDLIYYMIVRDILRGLVERNDRVIDIGGGTGRFSLELAERVSVVTHVDLSENMLAIARQRCEERNLGNVTFVKADARNLSAIADRSFSVGLAINGVITFSAEDWELAVSEMCRISNRLIVMTAASIVSTVPAVLTASISSAGTIEQPVDRMLTEKLFLAEEAARYGIRFPSYRAFFPEELEASLRRQGFEILDVRGIASLCRLVPEDALRKIVADEDQLERFLDLERRYTSSVGRRSPAREWLLVAKRTRSEGRS